MLLVVLLIIPSSPFLQPPCGSDHMGRMTTLEQEMGIGDGRTMTRGSGPVVHHKSVGMNLRPTAATWYGFV